ncbi:MAG: hypothetical protein AMXMBFR56_46680 [Polyangiaceae bacterium]
MFRWCLGSLALLLVWLTPRVGSACSCGDRGSPTEARDGAAQVFRGKVVAVREAWGNALPYSFRRRLPLGLRPNDGLLVDFEVARVWKGPLDARRRILTGYGGGDCGLGASVGDDWLIYAHGDGGVAYANICSRSTRTPHASRDLTELGAGAEPEPRRAPLALLLPLGVLALGLGLAGYAFVRRRDEPSVVC